MRARQDSPRGRRRAGLLKGALRRRGALLVVAGLLACGDVGEFARAQRLGGVRVPARVLERGKRVYERYCQACHGERGDGLGWAAEGQWPPPRDFRRAVFKFAGIEDRGLPHDDELARIIVTGLAGTAMRDWDLSDLQVRAVTQYIKTFSPPGEGFRSEELEVSRPSLPADPFSSPEARAAAVSEGRKLYHSMFRCSGCHPAYVGAETLRAWGVQPRSRLHEPVAKWSPNFRAVLLPPDFTRHPLRAVGAARDREGGLAHDVEDLVRTISYGLQGPMPGYGHLGAERVWSVAHYVKSLADLRGAAGIVGPSP